MNAYVGGRNVRPSDIEDMLCGPQETPTDDENPALCERIARTAKTAAHTFHQMVEEILTRKEQDERERETEGREARHLGVTL